MKERAAPTNRASVLVVDDDDDFRTLMRLYLSAGDFAVAEAADGYAGLKLIQQQEFDLIVLDLIMPERDGIELIRSVRSSRSKARIWAVSGARQCSLLLEIAAAMGVDLVSEKPINRDHFNAALHRLGLDVTRRQDLGLPNNA